MAVTSDKWRVVLIFNLQAQCNAVSKTSCLSAIYRQFSLQMAGASDRQLQLALRVRRCLLMVHILVPSVS
jgi:hypothetical protein